MAVIKSLKDRSKYEAKDKNGKRIPKLKNPWTNPYCKWPVPDYKQRCKSSSRDDILDYIVRTHLVEWYVSKLLRLSAETDEECREYIQEIYLMVSEIKEEKWKGLYNQGGEAVITAFVSGMIVRNCISKSSKAYKVVRGWKAKRVCFPQEILETIDEDGNFKLTTLQAYEEGIQTTD